MKGFFSTSKLVSKKTIGENTLPKCGTCGLYKTCLSPKMPLTGKGKKKILIVAEAPGMQEDEQGIQLVGKSGQLLRNMLKQNGISLDKDCWKTNAIICRPENNDTPDLEKIKACRPNLLKTIKTLQPVCIILLGGVSTQSLIGYLLQEGISNRSLWMGYQIPNKTWNTWICPTYHPAYLLRAENSLVEKQTQQHLQAAIKKAKRRPWGDKPVMYEEQVEIIHKPSKAIPYIKQMTKRGGTIAFDYEANCLKPEYEGSQLYSCSICWNGKRTIAFPWSDSVIEPMIDLLQSTIKKVAANIKFEDRWTRHKLHTHIKAWHWDTMLAAHIIDNRKGATGLKFQSFAVLGQDKYNTNIENLLQTKGKNHINRIHEIDMNDLLLYNGLDSVLEYNLAKHQQKLMGVVR